VNNLNNFSDEIQESFIRGLISGAQIFIEAAKPYLIPSVAVVCFILVSVIVSKLTYKLFIFISFNRKEAKQKERKVKRAVEMISAVNDINNSLK